MALLVGYSLRLNFAINANPKDKKRHFVNLLVHKIKFLLFLSHFYTTTNYYFLRSPATN